MLCQYLKELYLYFKEKSQLWEPKFGFSAEQKIHKENYQDPEENLSQMTKFNKTIYVAIFIIYAAKKDYLCCKRSENVSRLV